MQNLIQIGETGWTCDDIRNSIPEFLELYKQRPIQNNRGGMESPHMFATWFILKQINPEFVIESGVWKGLGTWLIEKTLPDAHVFSIDPELSHRKYKSSRVRYFNRDFSKLDWSFIPEKSKAVLFFDDHQNAFERVRAGRESGFRHFIFEDNYPAGIGDCYSLKKALQHAGHNPGKPETSLFKFIRNGFRKNIREQILPNTEDSRYLNEVLDIYYEFPPVIKKSITRWGDSWDDDRYPTPKPLFRDNENETLSEFDQDALSYTWICYARIR